MSDRSDGFRQFISFLLSASIESKHGALEDTLLLIDEPETHLHPTAQQYLLDELRLISKKNILFFATHSSYLIDKEKFNNYYRIFKEDQFTKKEQFENEKTSFSEINYNVFKIPSSDYHNELYGKIEAYYKEYEYTPKKETAEKEGGKYKYNFNEYLKEQIGDEAKTKKWQDDRKSCSEVEYIIQTYIRHQIHHPENSCNNEYIINDDKILNNSIKQLMKVLSEINIVKKQD
jgi:hypothetical protein